MSDPILTELYRHRFASTADDMGLTLQRTAHSPNIRERLDFSCAVFDPSGGLVAQAAHIPVHLGAMPASVAAALEAIDTWRPGDLVLLNDPYAGGTHLPDLTMVSPVFAPDGTGAPLFFVASRAHHADVGGMTPGSLPIATELVQEGLVIPPVRLYAEGQCNTDLLKLLLRNVRTPAEREGDLAAQRAAHVVGERRLHQLMERHGRAEVTHYARHLQAYSERLMRAELQSWPEGTFAFEDTLEGGGHEATIRATLHRSGDSLAIDFDGTSAAVPTSFNAVLSITRSACYYAIYCLTDGTIPMNGGCFAPVHVTAPSGSIVHARPPSAVAAANVETSQRIVDVVLGALAQMLPNRVAAASQGTMNNLTVGGTREDGSPFAYYETIAGGMGASATADGLSAVQVHMTNTRNTPVEALEQAYPFRVEACRLRRGSGGRGQQDGGDGMVRTYHLLRPATVTLLTERRATAPWGLAGGQAGTPGRNTLYHPDGSSEVLPGTCSRVLPAGSRIRIETPGGGGYGGPAPESATSA